MSREDKEQQARIALLEYFGSLARHWATVLLATVVAFYSVVQLWKVIHNDWWIIFALAMTTAGGVYAFLRVVTHGKYCELALDPEVSPRGCGTCVSQMLHGMLHHFRTKKEHKIKLCKYEKGVKWGRCLDKLGIFPGWLYWGLGWAIGTVLALVGASTCGLLPPPDLLPQLRSFSCPDTPVLVLVLIVVVLVLLWLFRKIDLEDYENETPIPPYGSKKARQIHDP